MCAAAVYFSRSYQLNENTKILRNVRNKQFISITLGPHVEVFPFHRRLFAILHFFAADSTGVFLSTCFAPCMLILIIR